MNKLRSLVVVFGIFCGSFVYAMPIAPLGPLQATLTIEVGYGCSLSIYLGPLDECAPVYVYSGYDPYYRAHFCEYYRGNRRDCYAGRQDAYYPYVRHLPGDVVYVDKGVCSFGSYLSCNHGICWQFCY